MKNKFIILDRDGTLNIDEGYTYKTQDLKFFPDVFESLSRLKKEFKFIIITNQSGIGRGYYTEEDVRKFNNKMLEELKKRNIKIEKTYFCPHHPDHKCDCRKPNPKFIKEAEKEFNIDLKESWVIGDHGHDIGLGKNAGCKTIYLLTGHGVKHLDDARKQNPDYIAANLKQAADYMLFSKENKIIPRDKIEALAKSLKQKNKKIATINGTFDILHKGHEFILKEAKKQGDILIAGLNSDSSVRQNKGPSRPLNNENARAKMLANFDFVDYVVIFNETTPIKLLELIKPNVHVNGSEYGKGCIEAETVRKYGGRIHIVKLIKGYSTTNMIKTRKEEAKTFKTQEKLVEHYSKLLKSQESDFRSLNLRKLILKYAPKGIILDLGCGPGFMSRELLKRGDNVVSADIDESLLKMAKEVCSGYKTNIIKIKEIDELGKNKFDAVICLDVLEHIKDDAKAMKNIRGALKDKGNAIIAVPAFGWLYGKRDKEIGHYRRYNKKELLKKLENAGFEIKKARYWNALGFIVYLFFEKILKARIKEDIRYKEKKGLNKLINNALSFLLGLENKIKMPFGLSLIVIAKKA